MLQAHLKRSAEESVGMRTHSFIVRIWLEETGQDENKATWRGKITHVPGGEQRYIRDLNGIISFVVPYLEIMGVKVSDDYRLIHWLKQISDRFR